MVKDSFFLISTGCMREFPDNSRSRFKNVFPKTASVQEIKNELYISLDQINCEQNFNYYDNSSTLKDGGHDITFYDTLSGTVAHYDFKERVYTIDDLIQQLNEFVVKSPINFMEVTKSEISPNGLKIKINETGVTFSRKLWNFLNFRMPEDQTNDNITVTKKSEIFSSRKTVALIEYIPPFISIKCDEVEPYSKNGIHSKIIAKVPLINKQIGGVCHYDSQLYQYFRLSGNRINTISIELLQPNGERLFLADGAPTIVKANIKEMNPTNDFFYVQVSSEPSESFPANNNNRFNVSLPYEYNLQGEWQVALTNLYLPPNKVDYFAHDQTEYHHAPEDERTIMFVKHLKHKPEFVPADPIPGQPYSPFKGYYKGNETPIVYTYPYERFTKEQFIKAFFYFANYYHVYIKVDTDENFVFHSMGDRDGNERDVNFFMSKRLYDVLIKDREASNITPQSLLEFNYLPEVTKTAINKFKNSNNGANLMTGVFNPRAKPSEERNRKELTLFPLETYYEKEYYYTQEEKEENEEAKKKKQMSRKKASTLFEKILQKEKNVEKIFEMRETNPSWMFVYSDIVKPTIMAGNFNNLLKLVPYKNNAGKESGGFYNFPSLDFFPVNRSHLRTLEIIIKTHSGKDYNYYNKGNVSMTLLFKKIKDAL